MNLAEKVVEITIASYLELIDVITLSADHLSKLSDFDDEEQYRVNLAVRESVANAIEHGNKHDREKTVEVRFTLTARFLKVVIRDHGAGFDPQALPDPLDPENLLNPAGRGILYMRSFMDEVDLIRHPDGGMQITMVKARNLTPTATPVVEGTQDATGN